MPKNILKNKYLMLILSFVLASGLALMLPGGQDMALYGNVIRLHIIAESDSTAAQQLKLRVRDEVLETGRTLLKNCDGTECARQLIRDNLPLFEQAAKKAGAQQVQAVLTDEYYPTRQYENSLRLPAGRYQSLQIRLGSAQGHNWWCVIYPGLCLSGSKESLPKLTDPQAGGNYTVKFKIMEWLGSLSGQDPA